jgi:hypothetical protein
MNRTHRAVRASFYLSLALPFAALACGDSFTGGSADGGDDTGIVFGDGGGHDATTADGPHDAVATDGPHDAGVHSDGTTETGTGCPAGYQLCGQNCVPDAPVGGIAVAPSGNMSTSCGGASLPCGTIGLGISQAQTLGKGYVFLAEGTYQEQVTLPAGITLQGGWVYAAGQWSRACTPDASLTVIQAPAGSDRVVGVSYSAGNATLDTLKISNPSTAAAGTSLYGVFASNSQTTKPGLTLTNVIVSVAAGGSAGNGTQGLSGTAPPMSCLGSNPGGGAGVDGGPGPAAVQGTYGPNGFVPQAGGVGQNGTDGENGLPAPGQGGVNGPTCLTVWSAGGKNDTVQSCCTVSSMCGLCSGTGMPLCGTSGTSGCGSSGAKGGAGGPGGGASVGVFSYNFALTLDQVTVNTGNGGTGGNGGPGGGTVTASIGLPGQPSASAYMGCNLNCGTVCACIASGSTTQGDAGAAGGNGGTGGTGGQGGGGAGGDSLCYATAGTTAMVSGTPVTCNAGMAGAGGNLANLGATGRQGLHN